MSLWSEESGLWESKNLLNLRVGKEEGEVRGRAGIFFISYHCCKREGKKRNLDGSVLSAQVDGLEGLTVDDSEYVADIEGRVNNVQWLQLNGIPYLNCHTRFPENENLHDCISG